MDPRGRNRNPSRGSIKPFGRGVRPDTLVGVAFSNIDNCSDSRANEISVYHN